jgi:hypothetical protein
VLKATRKEQREIAAYQGLQLADFDVYLCYREVDKSAVRQIAARLLEMNIIPWLDEWEVSPDEDRQQKLEVQIPSIGKAAVFVGNGLPPWQDRTEEENLHAFAHKSAVIPVALQECQDQPDLPDYITRDWVDLRQTEPDPIAHLIQRLREK